MLLKIFYLLILPKLQLQEYWWVQSAFPTMYFAGNTSLALELVTVSQLKNDILAYSSYAGIKYWQIELDAVNSLTIGTFSGLKQRITKCY